MTKVTPVLLCGGAGTRLWPLSRKSYPKQFVKLTGEESLFQDTAKRFASGTFGAPVVVTSDPFRFIVTEQLATVEIIASDILIEPDGKDTGPAILSAALLIAQRQPEGLMLCAPSDHVISDHAALEATITAAVPAADAGALVTFGIAPDRPETGYGYLELQEPLDAAQHDHPVPLVSFVEKPKRDVAEAMVKGGRHLWNAGIFLFRADSIIDAFKTFQPEMYAAVKNSVEAATRDLAFTRLDPASWSTSPALSIDYAVMEKAENLKVMPFCSHWSDLGDWAAVWRETETDGIAKIGAAHQIDCETTLLRSEAEGQTIVGIGLRDIIAVAMPDAVLVAHKDRTQDVKLAVAKLKLEGAVQAEESARSHRPWGFYESIAKGSRFQVKRIVVHPGAALSLQSHHHRAEHWIVVQGTAKVTIDSEVKLVTENQSVYIPLGVVHRLENPGKLPMVLIEVQTGSYLGEDDIIRLEDNYARK